MGILESLMAFPYQVWFILGNEFCERFSFYGMRSLLYIYFKREHGMPSHISRAIQHAFNGVAYLTPLLGAVMADSCFGKYYVILVGSIFYVLGHVSLSAGALPFFGLVVRQVFDYVGLLTIAVSTGGIKPCVAAFGADQIPPEKAEARSAFFSYFYMAINAGSVLSMFLTPQLRDISCAGSTTCYPLAFGVPGILMLVALILFVCGTCWYVRKPPARENLAFTIIGCITLGLSRKICGKKPLVLEEDDDPDEALRVSSTSSYSDREIGPRMMVGAGPKAKLESKTKSNLQSLADPRRFSGKAERAESAQRSIGITGNNDEPKKTDKKRMEQTKEVLRKRCQWLDGAAPNYSEMQIWGVKCLLSILWVIWPLCFFWFLYDQQSTTWVDQATHMNGKIGHFYVNPETMQMFNAVFIIIYVPVCKYFVYPLCEKVIRLTFLRKLGIGLVMAAFGFFISGYLQLAIDYNATIRPDDGHVFVQRIGSGPNLTLYNYKNTTEEVFITKRRRQTLPGRYVLDPDAQNSTIELALERDEPKTLQAYVFALEAGRLNSLQYNFAQTQELHETRVILFPSFDIAASNWTYYVKGHLLKGTIKNGTIIDLKHTFWDTLEYTIIMGPNCTEGFKCKYRATVENLAGPVHVLYVEKSGVEIVQVMAPFALHVMWQLPQILTITFGEVWLSVTGLEFVYDQSPPFMKSMMQAIWTLTISIGNILEVIWSMINPLAGKAAIEAFVYGGIIIVVTGIYVVLACRYQYIEGFPTVEVAEEEDEAIGGDESSKTEEAKKLLGPKGKKANKPETSQESTIVEEKKTKKKSQ
ncbi:unnamed protein product, partial [Mesorhabditis belari]|uniref:Uncharacterized protein n=1 Tax=Mesorhabditis belari TaxID=2138241 RepID=A0AAF3J3N1_9BILA